MSELKLTGVRLQNGKWAGRLTGSSDQPDIRVTHLDQPVAGVELSQGDDPASWDLTVPVPAEAIADGVQVILVTDSNGQRLGDMTLIAGEALADDIRAEMELLRAELDMLKRAFRRHCVETA